MSIGSSADGGYTVPKIIDDRIESFAFKQSPIRQIANVVQATTSDYHKVVNARGWGASWISETGARTASTTPTLTDITFSMGDLCAFPQATQAMVDDSMLDMGNWIAEEIGGTFGATESDAFLNGNGTNSPKGILVYSTATTADGTRAVGTIKYLPTTVSGAFAATPNSADILLATIFDLKVGYRANAKWCMHPTTLQIVMSLKDSNGRYITQQPLSAGAPMTLFGYDIVEAESMPIIAANSLAILFGDFQKAYTIVDRTPTRILVDPFSNKPYVGYYCVKRLGGGLVNSEAIRVIKFSAT
jgi:HK97 family phage major capsid protein